jgi:O-antigen ligase
MTRPSHVILTWNSIPSSLVKTGRTILTSILGGISIAPEQRPSLWEAALVLLGAIAVAGFILLPTASLVLVIACLVLWFLGLVSEVFRGRIEGLLLCWAAVLPLGGYFLAFPREHAIVTLDRVVISLAFLGMYFIKPSALTAVPKELRHAGLASLVFFAVACTTLGNSPNALNAARILLDGFVLPVLLGWCVIARFDVRAHLPSIHTAVCISSIISATVAAAEIVTGQDLLPFGTAAMAYGGIVRPNGPFESNDTLALMGAISFFFLLFLGHTLGPTLSVGRRILHFLGLAASLGMALMPMFRSVAITLLLVLIIDTFWQHKVSRRAWRVALMCASAGVIFIAPLFAPEVFEDRSNGQNAYARIAEYEQSFRVFAEHPLLGVGFQNFNRYVSGELRYVTSYQGVTSVDWPHSNLSQILTETGLLGFVPYMMATVFLFRQMWQLRLSSSSGSFVWKYFVYMFLSYWITGITEGSGYSPLNLWYVFAIAVACKYVLTQPEPMQPEEPELSGLGFSLPSHSF